MKDCKVHYSDMYDVRLGMAPCPWCKIADLQAQNSILSDRITELSGNSEGGVITI